MTLPSHPITPIPNNEPEAIPSLWNVRYQEIDENFDNLDHRTEAIESEIQAARAGKPNLSETISAIVTQIGGISGTLNGLASPTSVQNAVNLDWLYRNRRIIFELFADGYRLQNHAGVSVVQGISGDDSIDVIDTAGIKPGEDYLLQEGNETAMIRVSQVLTGQRVRLAGNLARHWTAAATLTGRTLATLPAGGVQGAVGGQWISKAVNLGDDVVTRAVVIRRTLNAGEVKLFFRDGYTQNWQERPWSVRRSGGGTSGVPEGFADYEYALQMRGDGYLRLEVSGEPLVIRHIVGLGIGTGLAGYVNPAMRPAAPAISSPANDATNITETPTIALAGYSSPAGNAFGRAQFQLSTSNAFASLLHDSGEVAAQSYAVPKGVLPANTAIYAKVRVQDVAGMWSDWSAVSKFTTKASYAYINTPAMTSPGNGQTDIPEQPTLSCSAFAQTGGSPDTHDKSQWQIRASGGTWASPAHDSGETAVAKTSYTVPAGVLAAGQAQYVLRVRHKGAALGWSEWSQDVAITTKQQFAQILGIVCTATGGGAGSWQRVDENFAAISPNAATFNNHATYAGIVAQTIDGQAMNKLPKFYVKAGSAPSGAYSGKRYWMVSDQPAPGFVLHPAFMKAGSPVDQVWVGRYQATDEGGGKMGSQPGKLPLVSIDFPTMQGRATARNTGGVAGFEMWSWWQLEAIKLLCLIEMGGADSQTLIGQGRVSQSNAANTDASDVAQASWRGFVGLWGNVWQMVDGLQTDGSNKYKVWDKAGNKTYQTTGQTAPGNNWIVTTSTDSGASHDLSIGFVPAATDSQANSTFADYSYASANCVAYHGGDWGYGAHAGLFFLHVFYAASSSNPYIGSRLAKV